MTTQGSYRFLLFGTACWCALVVLPAVLSAVGSESASVTYHLFSRICHQNADRSIHVMGYPLGVCARCSMIYTGFFLGVVIVGLRGIRELRHFRTWFVVVLIPMLLDVALDLTGVSASTMVTRVLTGLMFGVGCGLLLAPLAVVGLTQLRMEFGTRKNCS